MLVFGGCVYSFCNIIIHSFVGIVRNIDKNAALAC